YSSKNNTKSAEEANAAAANTSADSSGVIYEPSNDNKDKKVSTVTDMAKTGNTQIIAQMKAAVQKQTDQLRSIVEKLISDQGSAFYKAQDDDSMWKFLADGNFTVDAATKAQAQKDIGEDGYWGVKQTSQRLFDFASALAGDDVEKMKKMQAAMEKGYRLATKSWGRDLPGISKDTLDAANQLFDDYYKSKGVSEE
ncbi:MAG: hypothetical protein IJT04_02735, partial [Bacteroidales bacterium]|nr:hypothetical protein [Bacteroidales bacterium]